jgi:hypothetical protein
VYHKMLTTGNNIKKNVVKARKVCTKKPQSQSCRVAWEQVEELCTTVVEFRREEEELIFYDV